MAEISVRSRTVDKVAAGFCVLYAALSGLALYRLVVSLGEDAWLVTAIAGVILAFFGLRTWDWAQAANARVRIDESGVARAGRLGWRVLTPDLAYFDIITAFGQPYLVVMPTQQRRRNDSRLFLRDVPHDGVAVPLDRAVVVDVELALAALAPRARERSESQ